MELSSAAVVAQSFPKPQNLLFLGRGQGIDRRQYGHETLKVRLDRFHLSLLEHDFAKPNGVRVAGPPPGQIAGVAVEPRTKLAAESAEPGRRRLKRIHSVQCLAIRLARLDLHEYIRMSPHWQSFSIKNADHTLQNPHDFRYDRGVGSKCPDSFKSMQLSVHDTKEDLGRRAAAYAAEAICAALTAHGRANIILATGTSQFEVLAHLVTAEGINWPRVTVFHLDEYLGLSMSHPASFRGYLKERFVKRLPQPLATMHYIDGEAADPQAECARLGEAISQCPIDVALVGIGENGHLAFNDPPADFETDQAYLVLDLDEACRRQQLGEGWFATLDDVPLQAISMSIRQIMRSARIVCSVPDRRKAFAVQQAVQGVVTPLVPASILQEHSAATIYLDRESASLLS